jgi:hypothetical protein
MNYGVVAFTTLTGASAAVSAILAMRQEKLSVVSLQEHHA